MLWQEREKDSQQEREKIQCRISGKYKTLPHLHFERILNVILVRYAISNTQYALGIFYRTSHVISVFFSNATVRVSNLLVCP